MKNFNAREEDIAGLEDHELKALMECSIGRVLKLGSRKAEKGEVREFEICSWIVRVVSDVIRDRENFKGKDAK